jgi:hypothetical protein
MWSVSGEIESGRPEISLCRKVLSAPDFICSEASANSTPTRCRRSSSFLTTGPASTMLKFLQLGSFAAGAPDWLLIICDETVCGGRSAHSDGRNGRSRALPHHRCIKKQAAPWPCCQWQHSTVTPSQNLNCHSHVSAAKCRSANCSVCSAS